MQITLAHEEIQIALTEFVKNQGFPTKNHKVTVEFEKVGLVSNKQYRAIISIDPQEPTIITQEELAIPDTAQGINFT